MTESSSAPALAASAAPGNAADPFSPADEFSRALLATIPFGMEIVNAQGTILFLNDKLRRRFGENAVGSKCWDLYKDDKKMCPGCPLREGLKLGATSVLTTEGCFGGRVLEIAHTGMIYAGKPAVLEIFQDVTERRRIEQMKDDFVSMVSHEIRTPLTSIREGASQIVDGLVGPVTSAQKQRLELVLEESDRLTRLLNNILDLSRIESGRLIMEKTPVDLARSTETVLEKMRPFAAARRVTLKASPSSGAPPVLADPDKLEQILMNLMSNAIKFTPGGGTVTVSTKDKGRQVECSVTDTGIGIRPEQMDKLFGKFRQFAPPPGGGPRGTGLGLAIAKELIELHGGKIRAESQAGAGTCFIFTLPAAAKG